MKSDMVFSYWLSVVYLVMVSHTQQISKAIVIRIYPPRKEIS